MKKDVNFDKPEESLEKKVNQAKKRLEIYEKEELIKFFKGLEEKLKLKVEMFLELILDKIYKNTDNIRKAEIESTEKEEIEARALKLIGIPTYMMTGVYFGIGSCFGIFVQ